MRLEIVLKSDLSTSSGENFNSFIDTDVVYDDYGFPYIPAKRLKGVLKEAALELVDFGLYEKTDYQKLFGIEGIESGLFTIDDAYLENYEDYIKDIKRYLQQNKEEKTVVHPQRVLELYTYTRNQTAMTPKGIAKDNSLRTFRVVNSGEQFVSKICENGMMDDIHKDMLCKAASLVKHIGNSRTRGMGQVEMKISMEEVPSEHKSFDFSISDKNIIDYKITLNGPMLCKTSDGNQERTEDYIQGSKTLGILAGVLGKEAFGKLMGYSSDSGSELIVSNAYICVGEERCTPIPSSYQKKKDQSFCDGNMYVKDMLSDYHDQEQWTPLGQGYISNDGTVKTVETQVNYHHKRPENKALGRATGDDNSAFYQLRSICKGQSFRGFMVADREQTETILRGISTIKNLRIGNSKNTEYGNSKLQILDVRAEKTVKHNPQNLVVKLNAATILYNQYGMPTSEVECLTEYLAEKLALNKEKLILKKCFVTYEDIGGFNVTWHRRKPYFTSLGKGSVFLYECRKEVDSVLPEKLFLGERVSEGYGEIEILETFTEDVLVKKYVDGIEIETDSYETDIVERLKRIDHYKELREIARKKANECAVKNHKNPQITATLSKLLLLSKKMSSMKEIEEQIDGIETLSKKKLAKEIFRYINECMEVCTPEERFKIMLPEYLTQLKYVFRAKKMGEEHDK